MIDRQTGPEEATFRINRSSEGGWEVWFRKTANEMWAKITGHPLASHNEAVEHAKALVSEADKQTFLDADGKMLTSDDDKHAA